MNRTYCALGAILLASGVARASIVTTNPYVIGAGRSYFQTGQATHFQVGASFFDVFFDIEMEGPLIPPPPPGPAQNSTVPANGTIHSFPTPGNDPLSDGLLVIRYLFAASNQYDTEMLQVDLFGGMLPPGTQFRESPTAPSTGHTSITDLGGGLYQIDSFFDVFTEISIDGGMNWFPSTNGPSHVELMPAPGAAMVFGLGGALAGRRRRRGC